MEVDEAPLVSFVIPVYNGEEYIADCLDSIFAQDYPNIEVIVVDDNSNDGTRAILQNEFHSVNLIALPNENYGHSRACNIGIESAKGEYIGLLDDDVELSENWISRCLDSIYNMDNVAAIATKIINPDGIQWPSESTINSKSFVGTFVGCGVFFEKSKIEETSYFPERYFVYGNEDKFAAEILNQGYRIKYEPSVETLHKDSTRGVFSEFRYYHKNRNLLWTAWTHDPVLDAIQFTFLHLIACFLQAIRNRKPILFIKLLAGTICGFKTSIDKRKVVIHPDWKVKK